MTFSNLEWYWWLIIAAGLVLIIWLKIKFVTWWNRKDKGKKKDKWGDEE